LPIKLAQRAPQVAIAGNPNAGKTSLFNRLTGAEGKVGNYPGITVDRHVAPLKFANTRADLIDVPGTYSLSARSVEEQIAIQALMGLPPLNPVELVVVVVDATQLARHLYLALQVIETGLPTVIALTMTDLTDEGTRVDVEALARELGVPVVDASQRNPTATRDVTAAIEAVLADPQRGRRHDEWSQPSEALQADLTAVADALPDEWVRSDERRAAALARWALLSIESDDELRDIPAQLRRVVGERHASARNAGRELDLELIGPRYAWIDAKLPQFLRSTKPAKRGFTDRIDSLLLHPVFGFVLFLTVMGIVFQSLFSWADPAIGLVEDAFAALGGIAGDVLPAGFLQDFVVEGLIAGVGSVVVFLPQILLLFFFIGLMEDTGYMARVAFLMDRIMKSLGLHGRAFVPMMSGFACAIPAVMATRTMERKRDRYLTMMVVPLMTCSARLPVYSLLIAALFPPSKVFGGLPVQGLLMVGMYVFSTVIALIATAVLSRTLLKGPQVPLILELPPYRLPQMGAVVRMMWQKSRVFLTEAGTVILVCTIALWLLLSYPKQLPEGHGFDGERQAAQAAQLAPAELDERLAAIDAQENGALLRNSYGGRMGHALEPVIEPLGFDWKIGVGLIGAFAAREVFVSTMGVVYGLGDEQDETSGTLREKIRAESYADGRPVYTPLVGLSLMAFFALACQCMSTLAAVKRETSSYRWPLFMFAYMTVLAWGVSFAIYQGGKLLGFA